MQKVCLMPISRKGENDGFCICTKRSDQSKKQDYFKSYQKTAYLFGLAAAVGVPFYFLTRGVIGSSNAATGMCLLMLPAFVFAMYEKDGLPLEKVLKNIIVVRFIRPSVRKYQVENMYEKKQRIVRKKGGRERVKKKK